MKRMLVIPFVSALLGGGVVVAVVAAAGDLGKGTKTIVTTVEAAAAPATPTNASQRSFGLTPHEAYVRDAPGVAFVTSTVVQKSESPFNVFGEEEQRQGTATGSGIVIDANGTILTNYHVIENAIKVTVSFEKGQSVEAKVVGKDPSDDLAVLRVPTDGLTLHPLKLGDSSSVEVGDPVYAIGNPFDLERTLTTGVISALQRRITAPNGFEIDNVLQTDAPINPGNSGGPLLNAEGEVIGINSQIETGGSGDDGSVGIGFSIPINTAKSKIAELEKGGTVRGAYLGLTSLTIDGSLSALNLPVKSGALVQKVEPGTAAANAGIHGGTISTTTEEGPVAVGGDIIVGIDGKQVTTSEALANDIEEKQPGDTVSVELERAIGGGKYKHLTLKAKLGERPNSVENPNTPEG
ncbi:MAG TPA: trypsin-like peptidase domain-containing protein [Solirubrobacteraceae bacterium]|jgi:S1-C subfamily serine protease|nr:trypsin-like peptidase domain-containing protein [Solirubrobacteraceae bacterium]